MRGGGACPSPTHYESPGGRLWRAGRGMSHDCECRGTCFALELELLAVNRPEEDNT